jgi:Zn/Cd-binding protein ZinT
MYIFTTAGTVTWASNAIVQAGDFVIYDGTKWDVIQKNVEAATESVAGYVQLATDTETNAGTVNTKAVSPRRLSDYRLNKKLASTYVVSSTAISTSGTNIDHNLNSDLVSVSVYDSDGYQIEVQVLIASNNRVTLTSGTTSLSACKVVIVGHNITDPNA